LDRVPLWVLVGPTASGKSELALALAERLDAEIVSLDSMQVYRGMDIGTAKPSLAERARVAHHMLDLVEPNEVFDVQQFLGSLRCAMESIEARGKKALFVGGTGFYLAALLRGLFEGPPVDRELRARLEAKADSLGAEALWNELHAIDPASAARLHAHDVRRVIRGLEVFEQTGRTLSTWQTEWASPNPRIERARLVGLHWSVPEQDARIRARTDAMFELGWRDEAVRLREHPGLGASAIQALGYRTMLDWADGTLDRAGALEEVVLRTRQFARRQRTWYRKFAIQWIAGDAIDRLDQAHAHLVR